MVNPGIEPHCTLEALSRDGVQNAAGQRVLNLEITGDVTNANVNVFSGSEVIMTAVGDITVKVTRGASSPQIKRAFAGCTCDGVACLTDTRNRDILKLNVGDVDGVDYDYTPDIPGYVESESSIGRNTNDITLTGSATSRLVYHSERFTRGPSLVFEIPVPAEGPYTVTTEFAENYYDGPNIRKFDIEINGAVVKKSLDIFAESGGMSTALVLSFPNIAYVTRNGNTVIEMKLNKVMSEPLINGITVTSS